MGTEADSTTFICGHKIFMEGLDGSRLCPDCQKVADRPYFADYVKLGWYGCVEMFYSTFRREFDNEIAIPGTYDSTKRSIMVLVDLQNFREDDDEGSIDLDKLKAITDPRVTTAIIEFLQGKTKPTDEKALNYFKTEVFSYVLTNSKAKPENLAPLKTPKKKGKKKIIAGVVLSIIIMAMCTNALSSETEEAVAYESIVATEPATVEEAEVFQLPPISEFYSFIDTWLATYYPEFNRDLVRFEVANYELGPVSRTRPLGHPQIIMHVWLTDPQFHVFAEELGRMAVMVSLHYLISLGFDPRTEWIAPSAFVQIREQGVTGAALVRRFSHSQYNFNFDRIDFRRY